MQILAVVLGIVVIIVILWDGFETIVLPRRVSQSIRLTRLFYAGTWKVWSGIAHRIKDSKRTQNFISFYGPLSLLMLLSVWAIDLIIAFALIQWGLGSQIKGPEGNANFWTDLYFSGVTFFTLGFGDVIPLNPLARVLAVGEAGTGFAFLAIIIGYLPVT